MSNTGIIPLDKLPSSSAPPDATAQGPSASSGIIPLEHLPSSIQPPGGGLGGWARKTFEGEGGPEEWQNPQTGGLVGGAVMSGGRGMGTLLDLISAPFTQQGITVPGSLADKAVQATKGTGIEKAAQHMQDAATWLKTGSKPQGFWEHVGAIGEQSLEFLLTDGLLKIAGKLPEAVTVGEAAAGGAKTTSAAMRSVEELKNAQDVASTLSKNPKLAGLAAIGLKASQVAMEHPSIAKVASTVAEQGTMQGAQQYLHTEDPHQAAIAGLTGGAIGGAITAAPELLSAVAKGPLGEWIQKVAPKAANIFDTNISVLHDQLNEHGWTTDVGAVGHPEFAAGQQQGAAQAFANMSGQATGQALENINAQPFFKVEIPETIPQSMRHSQGKSWVEINKPPRVFESDNPGEARLERSDLEDQINSPEFKRLPAEKQQAMRDAADQLDQQLGLSQISGPRDFEIAKPTSSLRTPGQAAEQLRATAQSGYDKLDQVSGGAFNTFRNQAKKAMSALANPHNSEEVAQAASDSLDEANRGMAGLFDKHSGEISPQYYAKMKTAWRYGKVLDNLHARLERMTNGITVEESERGAQRIMTGNTREISKWLDATNDFGTRTNREDVEELIGQQGVDNIKKLTNLLAKADSARATTGVLRNWGEQLSHDIRKGGIAGGIVGKLLGPGWVPGAAIGAAAGVSLTGVRALLKYAMSNPRLGDMVTYAAQNNVTPQIYAPLLSRMVMEPFQHLQGEKDSTPSSATLSPEMQQEEDKLLKEFK